jgi:hypothetical protein
MLPLDGESTHQPLSVSQVRDVDQVASYERGDRGRARATQPGQSTDARLARGLPLEGVELTSALRLDRDHDATRATSPLSASVAMRTPAGELSAASSSHARTGTPSSALTCGANECGRVLLRRCSLPSRAASLGRKKAP